MGQSPALCRPECQFSACRNVEHEATGGGTDLEVVVRDGDGQFSPNRGLGDQSRGQGNVAVVQQQCCVGPAPQHRTLQEVQLVVQKRWNENGGCNRSRLLQPHVRRRFQDFYDVGKKLGEGSFGNVHEATARPVNPQTGRPLERAEGDVAGGGREDAGSTPQRRVAVKIFRLAKQTEPPPGTPKSGSKKHDNTKKHASFEAERQMLATLEHPHIIRMHECFKETGALFIVLEVCRGGELYSRLVSRAREVGTGLDEPLSKHLFRQMLYAVGYMHSRNIVHRDIKTENFLLLGELGSLEGDTLKLCDFGTSELLTQAHPRCMENIGTLSYTAPEVYMNKGAAVPSDAWSLGVVLYVMLTGTNPFRVPGKKVDREETVRRIRHCDFERKRQSWINLSEKAKDLVQQFLVLQEDQRLACHEALQNSWVASSPRPQVLSAQAPVCTELALKGAAEVSAAGLMAHAPKVVTLLLRLPRLAVVQRLALECCAVAASEADLQTVIPWRDFFLALDTDQDGVLSYKEFCQGLTCLAQGNTVQTQQLNDCARALDLDGSGSIEWVEWVAAALLGSKGLAEETEPLSTAFRLVDRSLELSPDAESTEEVSQMISEWVPSNGGSRAGRASTQSRPGASPEPSSGFMLEDLRFVFSSMEAYDEL